MDKHDQDNHSNQMNPNNDVYWESRGWDERPDDWEERTQSDNETPPQSQNSEHKK
jgi:hypothetical protein